MPTPPYFLWDHWYVAGRSDQVRADAGFSVTIMDTRLVLFRDASGRVTALKDKCAHLGVALSLGTVRDGCVTCPFHGWTFDAQGSCTDIPALGEPTPQLAALRVPTFATREAGGLIWVFMTQRQDAEPVGDPVPEEFAAGGWAWCLVEDTWEVNYTRFCENMIDQVHLPYVHGRTIGRRAAKRGPIAPRITATAQGFYLDDRLLEFALPNRHHLRISDKMGIYMWGVPVSATTTRIFIVGLRRFARSRLFDPLFRLANRRILNEDRPVVLSQDPKWVTFGPGGDLLMRPDTAARAYRELLRERLDGSLAAREAPAADLRS